MSHVKCMMNHESDDRRGVSSILVKFEGLKDIDIGMGPGAWGARHCCCCMLYASFARQQFHLYLVLAAGRMYDHDHVSQLRYWRGAGRFLV